MAFGSVGVAISQCDPVSRDAKTDFCIPFITLNLLTMDRRRNLVAELSIPDLVLTGGMRQEESSIAQNSGGAFSDLYTLDLKGRRWRLRGTNFDMRLAVLTAISMLAFAANSILARLALADHSIDPLAYTGIRLASGALVLAAIAHFHARRAGRKGFRTGGSWTGAVALLLYAITFSIAYVMIGAGTGALVLFASVQIGMLAWAVFKGDRPRSLEWLGISVAFAGLVYLVLPGLAAPPIPGVLLMAIAGVSWGAYSLIGRGSRSPLADSTGNFVRCAPVGLSLICIGLWSYQPSWKGLVYALASGMIASGLGYIIWYSVLPDLSRTRAAFVQLTVPAIAAAGGVAFIGEPVTLRLSVAMVAIIGGVALGLLASATRTGTDLPRKAPSEDSGS